MTDFVVTEPNDEDRQPRLRLVSDNTLDYNRNTAEIRTGGATTDAVYDNYGNDIHHLVDGGGNGDVGGELGAAGTIAGTVDEARAGWQQAMPPPHTNGFRRLPFDVSASTDTLVARAIADDRKALDQLLAIIRPLVVRYCRGRVGGFERSFSSADDVAQEVCFAVLRALPTYRDQGRPFLAFVYGIAAHKVADAHRLAQRNRSDPYDEVPDAPEARGGPEQQALAGELTGQMNRLLDTLPAKQREILVMRVVVGLSAEETAEAVGSTAGAVRVAQHRALARLRGLIEKDPDF